MLLTTSGCVSLPESEPVFPPKPERQEQKAPETVRDYVSLLAYYESLVQQWELWAEAVEKMK